jgi:hypothetical protein
MFEQTGIYIKTIDSNQDGGLMDWTSRIIKWCRQLIEGQDLDHLEPFYEDIDLESRILPLVSELRVGRTKDATELYLIKVKYGDLFFRFALHDLRLTMKRITWEIEKTWPMLIGQEIYLNWQLLERDQTGKCEDKDLNESLEYIETIDKLSVHRLVIMEIHLPEENRSTGIDQPNNTIGKTDGRDL